MTTSSAAGKEQVWIADGLGGPVRAAVRPERHRLRSRPATRWRRFRSIRWQLTGYFDAVYEEAVRYVKDLDEDDLSRVVDTSWTPPVTLAVRLVSVISDGLQHAGQAFFVRGIIERQP